VAEVPDQPEDQKRDEEDVQLFSFVTKLLGQQRTMAKAMTQLADGLYEIAKAFEATELDVRKLWEAAYRAGREDLLRSGSCPECTAGDPHNEPDVPHIHLTPYGYLLYAADHERPGFIEEIRAVERRAGREDAARDILAALRQREDAAHETYARRQALGVGDQAAEWAVRSRTWRQARQAADEAAIAVGDGVQPTEEQRAEDQERDEGQG
jgi:hypothetical protein